MLVNLLDTPQELTQRQAAKALANLGVDAGNKIEIAKQGALPRLLNLIKNSGIRVKTEAVAAIANLAVDGELPFLCICVPLMCLIYLHLPYLRTDQNELEIARLGGIPLIMDGLRMTQEEELVAQCARAIRNLSVHRTYDPQPGELSCVFSHLQFLVCSQPTTRRRSSNSAASTCCRSWRNRRTSEWLRRSVSHAAVAYLMDFS